MDFLDIYDKELDIFCEDAKNSINISFSSGMIAIYESGDIQSPSFIDKVDKAITNLIEKIKKLFQDTKEKIAKFFTDKNVEEKCKEVETAVKQNPKVKEKKVSYKTRNKAIELDKITLEDIYKARDFNEVEAKMQKYRKQRNKAIVSGVLVTVTVGGVAALVIKHQKKLNDQLEQEKTNAEEKLSQSKRIIGKLKTKLIEKDESIKNLQNDVSDLKKENAAKNKLGVAKVRISRMVRKTSESVSEVQTQLKTEQAKANAIVEVSTNICKDIISEGKEMVSSILNPSISPAQKVVNTVSSVSKTAKTVKGASTTVKENSVGSMKEKLTKLNSVGKKKTERCKGIRTKLNGMDKNNPAYKTLFAQYKNEVTKLDKLKVNVESLRKAIADAESKG